MVEIHIDLKLSVKIPQEGIKINNLLYQLRKFMAELYFGILKAIFSAVEEKGHSRVERGISETVCKEWPSGKPPTDTYRLWIIPISDGQSLG